LIAKVFIKLISLFVPFKNNCLRNSIITSIKIKDEFVNKEIESISKTFHEISGEFATKKKKCAKS